MSLSLFSPSSYSLLPFHLPHSLLPRLSGAYIASPCNCDIILEEYNRIVCSGSQCHTSRSAQHYTPVITSYPPTPTVGAPPTRKLNHYTYITDAYVSLSYFPSILVPQLQKNAQSCTYVLCIMVNAWHGQHLCPMPGNMVRCRAKYISYNIH